MEARADHLPANEDGHVLTPEEGREIFERAARYYLNMTGDEFLEAWDSGQLDERAEDFDVVNVSMLIPLVRY